ncbi:MAG: carbamoyltransferase N-terminal domain-containing protein, partial [Phycisphaerae bacterium]
MNILGLSCYYHDAGAALVRDGRLVAAAEEERFTRKKHDSGFPENAVRYCLREAGITINDVDHIGFYEKPLVKFNRILESILATWPLSYRAWLTAMPLWLTQRLRIGGEIQKKLGTEKDILYCQHHLSHAASAFLVSPFDEAAVITADGVGEWTTTSWGTGRGSDIEVVKELRFPHSIG